MLKTRMDRVPFHPNNLTTKTTCTQEVFKAFGVYIQHVIEFATILYVL
jgi:hypothetical protein